ncbi:unnamed protein product, partial [Brassica rapa]
WVAINSIHSFTYITFFGIHMTSKPKKMRGGHGEHMEFGDHDNDTIGDGFKTANRYNGSIHVSGTGKEDNYLLKTFKLMLSNYVYTNIYS